MGTLQDFADFIFEDLRVEKLLGVLPLIERLGFIEPFIALEPNQLHSQGTRQHLTQLGFAYAGRPLDQNRLLQLASEIDHRSNILIANVTLVAQARDNIIHRLKHSSPLQEFEANTNTL